MYKLILIVLAFSATLIFSKDLDQDSVLALPADVAFSKIYVSVEGGEIYPWGDLIDAVENSLYGGVGFRYSYWDKADGFISFAYSYFKPVPNSFVNGVHQFSGKLGLDFKSRMLNPVIVGAGFTCNWTRADMPDDIDKATVFSKPGGTLADNETEFGWFARANFPIWNFEKTRVGINLLWEELWTLPEKSDMLVVGVYVERRIW